MDLYDTPLQVYGPPMHFTPFYILIPQNYYNIHCRLVRLGYLAFTQATRVQIPAMEFFFELSVCAKLDTFSFLGGVLFWSQSTVLVEDTIYFCRNFYWFCLPLETILSKKIPGT